MPFTAYLRLQMTFSCAPREFGSIVNCSDCSFLVPSTLSPSLAPSPRFVLAAVNPIRSYKRNCDFEECFFLVRRQPASFPLFGIVSLLSENKCTGPVAHALHFIAKHIFFVTGDAKSKRNPQYE